MCYYNEHMNDPFKTTPQVKALTGSKRHTFRIYPRPSTSTNSYWDGGSRNEYQVINMNTGKTFTPPPGAYPFTTPNEYTLQPGDVVIVTGTLMGKPAYPHFICREEELPAVKTYLGLPQ
jgi:hypothetical protein